MRTKRGSGVRRLVDSVCGTSRAPSIIAWYMKGVLEMAMERNSDRDFVFEIKAHLGVISTRKEGWKKELNLVSWNGQNPPKFDIRDWSEDHTKMGKGITLFDNELRTVVKYYNEFCNARVVSENSDSRNAAARAGLKAGEELRDMEGSRHDEAAGSSAINDSAYSAESKVPGHGSDADHLHVSETAGMKDEAEENTEDFAALSEEGDTAAESTPF